MSVLFEAHQVGLPTKSHKVSRTRRKEDDLLVFGYACKLFENSEKAVAFDAEKNLISWMGDETLRIDRYDARLYFTDKAQFTTKSCDLASSLTPEEQEIERQCDEERYMDLHRDMAQYEIQQEEEMKRFQQALQEDGTYNSVAFSYQYDAPPIPPQYPQTANEYESFQNDLQQPQQASTSDGKTSVSPPPTPPSFQEPEPFVPPKELEIPLGMEIPDTAKMQAIIERTAVFVTKQGKQMEILVKAKQSGNPQFDFLLMENWLNPYYKHVLKYITEGKYVPEIPKPPSVQTQEETKESDTDESEDDSDGEYELHPLLQASLHKKITRSKPSSASSSPIPHVLGNKFNRTFAPVTSGLNSTAFPCNQNHGDNSYHSEVDEVFDYSMWYPQDDGHGHFVSSAGYPYHPPMAPVLSVADLIPPPPPPPGEGPLEEEWLDSTTSVPPLPPPPPPPVPPGLFLPNTAEIPGAFPPPPPPGLSEVPLAPQSIIPPPPDLQPIVDKLATYVAKNGPDFESIIKAKDDPRFEFLNPWNTHHSYYNLKKQEALASLQLRKSEETQKNEKNSYEVPKGPISFSIKVKDTKKPKIEYRTSVIYKQSCEQGESDDDGDEEGSEAQYQDRNDTGGKQSGEMTKSQQEQEASNQTPAEDLNEQMDSIKAAERIAQNLESESRDKQLQIERRRKASLFISMLKKTNTGDETEANQSSSDSETGRSRKFMETKRDTRAESPSVKRSRIEDDDDDDDDDLLSIGVGAPSPGSIRVTQDLMAKVLAASKNK